MQAKATQLITIDINKCVGKPECKSDKEIENFLKNKTVIILYNQQSYDPTDYDGNPIHKTVNYGEF